MKKNSRGAIGSDTIGASGGNRCCTSVASASRTSRTTPTYSKACFTAAGWHDCERLKVAVGVGACRKDPSADAKLAALLRHP